MCGDESDRMPELQCEPVPAAVNYVAQENVAESQNKQNQTSAVENGDGAEKNNLKRRDGCVGKEKVR